jgi:hypothetical protein
VNQRLLTSIGIVSAVAAIAVPSALAVRPAQDDAGPVATSVSTDPSALARHAALGQLDTAPVYDGYKSSYSQLHDISASAPQPVAVRPDDKAGIRPSEPSAIVSVASTGDGFQWGDAAVGAGGAIGLFGLLGVALAFGQRGRKRPLAA